MPGRNIAGSNFIGPSAPTPAAALAIPGVLDCPLSFPTRPIAASTGAPDKWPL
jgi:hypothetical protein